MTILIEDEELDRLKYLLDEASEILQKCYTDDVLATEKGNNIQVNNKNHREALRRLEEKYLEMMMEINHGN